MGFFVYGGSKTRFCIGKRVMRKIDPVLHERLATLIGSMGYELVGCELLPQGRQMVFRIYIDGKNGVTLDDCSQVSYQVSAMLDVEDPIQGRYSLEISSPGIDRPLFELEHFRKFVGKLVKIRLHSPVNQRKQYKGVLQRVEGEDIYLLVQETGQEVVLPFSAIDKANLIGDVHFK
ncbi:Ribosome maturation factor RimP [Aquicella siphonis]|uniref:Ribosome maturation factor RimP n=1 Tax=Aquicella siphonis TaxID=254247 RepID=A0A5E4PK37_9COXI|nr:ribosome maturation factor RimP [Aquicella siphonis]VVC76751.1 Ribosome maturation factor RimP [Aquicella siphonis]